MLRLLCTLIFALFVHVSNGAIPVVKPVKQPLVLKMDTAKVGVRHLDSAAITAHSKQPEFQYKDDIDTTPSWWDRFWSWFWGLFKPIKLGKPNMSPFVRALLYILQYLFLAAGLAAVVFLVLKLMGIDMLGIFRRKSMSANLPFTESLENIHDINFDDEIERAISHHNYRLAVRMLYLKCLKQLSDAHLIKWQIDKTNSAYIDELTNAHQRQLFRSLTLQFEYVWYGEFAIDGQTFKNINTVFQDFNKGIA
ncbi:hypothetical protein SAMN05421821_12930 [Mucilaginibacter lappiensis]|uniref:Protein-glutamine gamma-glutamyltransferase-like C-terminal domain-containing protein n=1 Tax=Mucilaginibacter lappiensis TaxID=354630 RepID=A0ABR6PU06_9SPHI|nr:DUF4129 domain-containing protein [Mucilaginibacter lappiensis]MBB6113068.1 hypothetical protein [Mucilaginibacter lappiensis]SIS12257.1 hypothetical protein SAMN05421821_12930 [Mucilaginibacter lappiensis]